MLIWAETVYKMRIARPGEGKAGGYRVVVFFRRLDMRKYKSDIYEAVHEDAMADFEVGAISEARMREYDELCLVQEPEESYAAEPSAELEHRQSPLTLSLGS